MNNGTSPLIPSKPGRPRRVDVRAWLMPCSMCWAAWRLVTLTTILPDGVTISAGADGTWKRIHDKLYQWVLCQWGTGCVPSAVVLDSQSVETATMVAKSVGFDAAKHVIATQAPSAGRYGVSGDGGGDGLPVWPSGGGDKCLLCCISCVPVSWVLREFGSMRQSLSKKIWRGGWYRWSFGGRWWRKRSHLRCYPVVGWWNARLAGSTGVGA